MMMRKWKLEVATEEGQEKLVAFMEEGVEEKGMSQRVSISMAGAKDLIFLVMSGMIFQGFQA